MKSTATATLAAAALWLSGTIATIPALADDDDPGPLTAEEILAEDAAAGVSPDAPYPPYQAEDGGDVVRTPYAERVLEEAELPGDTDGGPGNGFGPLGGAAPGLDPTPDQLEQWAAEEAEFQAGLDAIWADLDASLDAMEQDFQDTNYLQKKWRESGSDQSFDDWLEDMANGDGGEDGESGNWSDDFEQWGDDDWDDADTRSAEEIRADRTRWVARRLRAEDALREDWKRSGSDLPYDEWYEQTYPPIRMGDFEEWGDDDWDDPDEPESEGNTQDSAWLEDLDAMSAGLMPGGASVDDPSALVDMIAADDDAILAVTWPAADGLAIAMGERDRLEAVRDTIAVGTPGPMGTVDAVAGAAISEPDPAALAAPGPGLVLMVGPSEFSD